MNNFRYDSPPREGGQRLFVVDLPTVARWRSGYQRSFISPTENDLTFYRKSVPKVIQKAVRKGYTVVLNTPGRLMELSEVASRVLRGTSGPSPNSRILFTAMRPTDLYEIMSRHPPSRDSIFVDRDGLPNPSGSEGSRRSSFIARETGTLWFSPAEIFPVEPLPVLSELSFPDKINVYILISNSLEAAVEMAGKLAQQRDVSVVPNVGDLQGTSLRQYLGKSVVFRFTTRYGPVIFDAISRLATRIKELTMTQERLEVVFTLLQLDVNPYIYARDESSLTASLDSRYTGDFEALRRTLVRDPIKVEL